MKVCLYLSAIPVNDALHRAVRENFRAMTELSADDLASWRETISGADLVLIDFTGANSLGSYCLGLAEVLGKTSILLSPVAETPSAFSTRRVIVHGWNIEFLKNELRSVAGVPEESSSSENPAAAAFHSKFGDLLRKHNYRHTGPVEFDGSVFTLREQNMDLALVQEIAQRARSLNLRVRLL